MRQVNGPHSEIGGVVLGTILEYVATRGGGAVRRRAGDAGRGGATNCTAPGLWPLEQGIGRVAHVPTNTPTGDDGISSVPAAPSAAAPIGSRRAGGGGD